MIKRGEFTPQKWQKATEDNEGKNEAHKKEMHRQGCRNYNNVRQSGNERFVGVTWDGEQQDLQVPINSSSTTSRAPPPEYLQPTRTDQYLTHTHTGHTALTNDI
jgi:hypothetical protein